jgi:hypothetical protein
MPFRLAAAAVILTLAAACSSASAEDSAGRDPDAPVTGVGMCAPDVPDCIDTAVGGSELDSRDADRLLDDARALLGTPYDELGDDIRIGRIGDEHLALTEDYQVGRMTVEVDPDDAGVHHVTSVTVELPDGPVTITS